MMELPDTERMIQFMRSSTQAAETVAVALKVIAEGVWDLARTAERFVDELQQLRSGDTLTPSANDSTRGES